MEACIMICKAKGSKSSNRVGKVLFINAKNEITRKDGFSYLEDKHIKRIIDSYKNFQNEDNFSAVVNTEDLLKNNSSLSIQYYVNHEPESAYDDEYSLEEYYNQWLSSTESINNIAKNIIAYLKGGEENE
jgi:type I restriction enzyme M protein